MRLLNRQSLCVLTACVVLPYAAIKAKQTDPEALPEHGAILLSEHFKEGLGRWSLSLNEENNRENPALRHGERLLVVPAPGMPEGHRALRVDVPRELGSFRSEIALEMGPVRKKDGVRSLLEPEFHERWYAASIYIPANWVTDTNKGDDILLQWHAVMGKARVDRDFPSLSISVEGDSWMIHRAFGKPLDIQRDQKKLDEPLTKGNWSRWVVHVRWHSGDKGLLEIWKDDRKVWEAKGPNTYDMTPHTPYFKTGIYHPTWKTKYRDAFEKENPIIPHKIVYLSDIKVGDENATYKMMAK